MFASAARVRVRVGEPCVSSLLIAPGRAGGWYDWNSDIPLLLRNAVLFAARKGASAPTPNPSFSH